MLDQIRHRGPDGENVWRDEPRGRAAFAHARLSIIDLLSGDQPMHVPKQESHGTLTLVFNGEIYNHRTLRRQLERLGHAFTSDHSDTEVILYGYREWGDELPKHLHGMFAFAIFDQQTGELFLCRDRVGKKPLYVRWSDDGKEIMFASLISALVRGGDSPPSIDRAALRYFLRLGYGDHRSNGAV
ncbi:MAG: asparagine synthetase B, partial [Planctomycetota bacterium]